MEQRWASRNQRLGSIRTGAALLALLLGALAHTSAAHAAPGGPALIPAGPKPPLPQPRAKDPKPASTEGDWARHVTLGGGVAVYYYQPTNGWQNQLLIYTNLRFDARFEWIGLHLEPRLSNEKMRSYYDGLGWIQEAYLSFEQQPFLLKVGKIYKQLGLFWDNSFYGNIQVYEGLKLDPNSGVSLEATFGRELGVKGWVQFFVVDGHTNASLTGRDTISIPGARRRNTFTARLQPFVQLRKNARLELGLSAERFDADLPAGSEDVTRTAVDAKLTWGGFGVWGEALHQSGTNVTDFPYPGNDQETPPVAGRTSADNTYLQAGIEYTLGRFTLRYDLSIARYADVNVEEVLHLPGLGVSFNEHASLLVEYASWPRYAPEGKSDVDQSLNVTVMGHF